jgi:hypothetical protein
MSMRSVLLVVAACGSAVFTACDGMPPQAGEGDGTASAAAAAASAAAKMKSDSERIAELELQVAELRLLLRRVRGDDAGNLIVAADLRVNGAVGINAAPKEGIGLNVVGDTVGAKFRGATGVMARGTGAAGVGLDADGAVNGVIATSKGIAVAAGANDYSFYGFKGLLRNDGNAVIRGDQPVRAGRPRAAANMVEDVTERRTLLAPTPDEADVAGLPALTPPALTDAP